MTQSQSYENLGVVDKVRVNGVILDWLERNPDNFINNLRRQAMRYNANDRAEGFQQVLDSMRDHLADELRRNPRAFPHMRPNGNDDTWDLMAQREAFRAIKDDIGTERGTPTNPYRPQSHYQNIASGRAQGIEGNMPNIAAPYRESGNMVLSVTGLLDSGCQERSNGDIVCSTTPQAMNRTPQHR